MRLLLLEDDVVLGEGLRDFLIAEHHSVTWCKALIQAKQQNLPSFDALLIDWQLPDGSGLQWLQALRMAGVVTPAIVLTARDLLAQRIQGLDAGADDYLVKPFEPEELLARLRALFRRSDLTQFPALQFGDVSVDLKAKTCSVGQKRIHLTAREWAVLEALVRRRGRIVPKSDLENLVLGSLAELPSNVLEAHISGLRRKLGRSLIETVRGLGYRIG